MNVPSYGVLKTKISCPESVVKKVKLRNEWLLKETGIQAQIITQLRSLGSVLFKDFGPPNPLPPPLKIVRNSTLGRHVSACATILRLHALLYLRESH